MLVSGVSFIYSQVSIIIIIATTIIDIIIVIIIGLDSLSKGITTITSAFNIVSNNSNAIINSITNLNTYIKLITTCNGNNANDIINNINIIIDSNNNINIIKNKILKLLLLLLYYYNIINI